MLKKIPLAALALFTALASLSAQAAPAFPADRPIALVVPFSAGGGTDILARLVAAKLGAMIRQSVVVENKPGANGVLASQYAERAKADGYTLMFGGSSTHVLSPLLSPKKQQMEQTRKNFSMVGIVAETPLVLAVNAKSSFKNLDQLLKASRDRELTFGTFGSGSSPHIMGALLAARTNARLQHVPYKGSSPAITELLGGHIDSVFLTVAALSSHVEDKEVRALAVTGARRVQTLPDVPTFKEAGVSGFEDSGWFAVFAPAGTPEPVMDFLHDAIGRVMATPEVQAKLVELGLRSANSSRALQMAVWERSIVATQGILTQVKIETDR
ncbi:tripartite tricarboxylate transporter substrate binding protein [Variovorax sp. Varisp85]|jgi:tripartite-type tricarboxylate transporter receptor subunit TctC|uniref:Tripartite-type tricarboxylate transporter receptor subunit TctC n=1 Tax=Variovorax beijingensis TaxID=2496117 RepID=A0A561BGI7_9BURK|nr:MULTISPECIES: tripartite tricarboxylate transporter substrate binding protein [Variovorax]MBD9663301.1 tripartite tricarboxylate transporter substrate binding protein [Variovorax sp. VRV01]TWD77987.1 tripartite-type tricarboxylate transporter receptor subunit TctC [Variovorax beijingensis]